MDRKRSYFPSLNGNNTTNWDITSVHMSVVEEAIRKEIGRFNTPVEFCWCTNYPRYHADRFNTYINCPNKRDLDVAEQAKQSIQEYDQSTSIMVVRRGDQYSQGQRVHTLSMSVSSIFAEQRVQLTRYWKKGGFWSLGHALHMCEIMDPSTSRSVRLECSGSLKDKCDR